MARRPHGLYSQVYPRARFDHGNTGCHSEGTSVLSGFLMLQYLWLLSSRFMISVLRRLVHQGYRNLYGKPKGQAAQFVPHHIRYTRQ